MTTPNIVTEVSNLLGHMKGEHQAEAAQALGQFVVSADAFYIPSRQATEDQAHVHRGVSDVATIASTHQTPEPLASAGRKLIHFAGQKLIQPGGFIS